LNLLSPPPHIPLNSPHQVHRSVDIESQKNVKEVVLLPRSDGSKKKGVLRERHGITEGHGNRAFLVQSITSKKMQIHEVDSNF